ncbi:MAG: hypothetical protein K6F64_08335 [Clostridia bacterium]|nr:hypothetical protein [Clostridia bacterium]
MKRIISLALCIVLICALLPAAQAEESGYIITSPYDTVDWDSWGTYKFQPHCHTNASDGYPTIHEFVQRHYDLDYDVVALTDHGTLNRGWNKQPDLIPLLRLVKKERTQMAEIEPLTDEEYEAVINGNAPSEIRTHKNGMLDVPLGVELNMATPVADCHLTGYWSEYGQGLAGVFGDYETPSRGVKEAGGISMLAHVGEYVYPDKDSADHVGQKIDEYYVNKFAKIFLDNSGSSVGMGINSATDAHTRCDRILYDQILQKTIPNGVTPWAFCFSDAHTLNCENDAYTMLLMKDFDLNNVRKAMETGAAFAVSHYSNGYELNGMQEMPGYSDDMKLYDNQEYVDCNDTPIVTRITVDEAEGTITIEGEHFDRITWVSDCNVIKREEGITEGRAVLDLDDDSLLAEPNLYVRFYITGPYGICYSQPFTILRQGQTLKPVEVPETHDISTRLRTLVTVLDWLLFKWNPIVWAFKYFALGYDPIKQTADSVLGLFK